MVLRGALLVGLSLALGGCRGMGPSPAPSAPGAIQAALPGLPQDRWLRVGGSEQEGARWFLEEGTRLRELPPPPVALFPYELAVSPDGRDLAVVSAGEGHPVLEVLSLERVLDGTHGDHPLWSFDPYPGSLELAGWAGASLRVRSDRPLDTCDGKGRPYGEDVAGQPAGFLLDPATGRFRAE